jgi:predicted Zn-dependent protease
MIGREKELIDAELSGSIIRKEFVEASLIVRDGCAFERIQRVSHRLQRNIELADRYTVEIVSAAQFSSFVTPGRYIYFSSGLLSICHSDEMVAFLLAHEIAYNRLGFMDDFLTFFPIAGDKIGSNLALGLAQANSFTNSPRRERAADRVAIELCEAAGYAQSACLEIFDALENQPLKQGISTLLFGNDYSSTRFARSIFTWLLGYPSFRERKKVAQKGAGK